MLGVSVCRAHKGYHYVMCVWGLGLLVIAVSFELLPKKQSISRLSLTSHHPTQAWIHEADLEVYGLVFLIAVEKGRNTLLCIITHSQGQVGKGGVLAPSNFNHCPKRRVF